MSLAFAMRAVDDCSGCSSDQHCRLVASHVASGAMFVACGDSDISDLAAGSSQLLWVKLLEDFGMFYLIVCTDLLSVGGQCRLCALVG